eukprot:tig00001366_g8383.t1
MAGRGGFRPAPAHRLVDALLVERVVAGKELPASGDLTGMGLSLEARQQHQPDKNEKKRTGDKIKERRQQPLDARDALRVVLGNASILVLPAEAPAATPELESAAENAPAASADIDEVVEYSCDQRWPTEGEPRCIVCGRYGAYVSDETNEDVCSRQCKRINAQDLATGAYVPGQPQSEEDESEASAPLGVQPERLASALGPAGQGALALPDLQPDVWDARKHRYKPRLSALDTYRCWRCGRSGHMAEACVSTAHLAAQLPQEPSLVVLPRAAAPEEAGQGRRRARESDGGLYSARLRKLYQRCEALARRREAARCAACGGCANLAHCLVCNAAFCDGAGHLTGHMRETGHGELYSYKLQRAVKCFQPDCEEASAFELTACATCTAKTEARHYDATLALWSQGGLRSALRALACEEHFTWHRQNCRLSHPSASEPLASKERLRDGQALLSDFFF